MILLKFGSFHSRYSELLERQKALEEAPLNEWPREWTAPEKVYSLMVKWSQGFMMTMNDAIEGVKRKHGANDAELAASGKLQAEALEGTSSSLSISISLSLSLSLLSLSSLSLFPLSYFGITLGGSLPAPRSSVIHLYSRTPSLCLV